MRAANAPLRKSATWSGPLVASIPNSAMVTAGGPMRTTIGRTESSRLGHAARAAGAPLVRTSGLLRREHPRAALGPLARRPSSAAGEEEAAAARHGGADRSGGAP